MYYNKDDRFGARQTTRGRALFSFRAITRVASRGKYSAYETRSRERIRQHFATGIGWKKNRIKYAGKKK